MSMYKFVKGARLFMEGKREDVDYDNVADNSFHGKQDDFRGRNGAGADAGQASMDDDGGGEVRAFHTYRNTEMEGTTSGERWSKSVRKGNIKQRSTRTVRKVTTITRGEQSVSSETVVNYSNKNQHSYPTVNNNKKNLKFRIVDKENSQCQTYLHK